MEEVGQTLITESEAQGLWRKLFRGQPITTLTIREASQIVDRLPEDSPVRVRLNGELDELKGKAVTGE